MSDSEYECSSPVPVAAKQKPRKRPQAAVASTSTAPPPQPASSARTTKTKDRHRQLFGDSENETEYVSQPPPAKKVKAKKTPSTGRDNIFEKIVKAEERASSSGSKEDRRVLYSSFTTRLAAGRQRRAAELSDGAHYIDLKIYNVGDALGSTPQTLYKKALVAVKLQAAEGSSAWEKVQAFIEEAYDLFKEQKPVLYKD